MLCYLSFNSETIKFSLKLFVSALYFYFLAFHPVASYFVTLVSVYLIFFLSYMYSLVYCLSFLIVFFCESSLLDLSYSVSVSV